MGSGDGSGNAELPEVVECFPGLAVGADGRWWASGWDKRAVVEDLNGDEVMREGGEGESERESIDAHSFSL